MINKPPYFELIRQDAANVWSQLERSPELAGPWHQLFMQVKSPRHVLSELLQNADDAGATEATVRIERDVFIFEHNGEDFTAEHLTSLCRFGYSNKRSLHTIGFRGIGFKSTFSLGDHVELYSPSLSIHFNARRFTEPVWSGHGIRTDGKTCIRVRIADNNRQREIEKNLAEWVASPVSLLFFNQIRRMQIGEHVVEWRAIAPGPIRDSTWMSLGEYGDQEHLLIRSQPEAFPQDALAEIQQERMLTNDNSDFPPPRLDLVLGAASRLFVVLPTGVKTTLPFACNAPFIQDPARMKIKDPEISPTNRWLLQRAGKLAATAILAWLHRTDLTGPVRASAYDLFPNVDEQDHSLDGACSLYIQQAFDQAIGNQSLLLTYAGNLTRANASISLPHVLCDIWSPEQAATLFDERGRPALSRHVEGANREKLFKRGLLDEIDLKRVLDTLRHKSPPKPQTWRQLLDLWHYVAPELARSWSSGEDVRIMPVQGQDELYAANQIVRLGEKKLLHSEDDWRFLAEHLLVLNQNWTNFLADQRRSAEEQRNVEIQKGVRAAQEILRRVELDTTSDINKVVEKVATTFFTGDGIQLADCVQLTQIAAKLNATIGDAFRYFSRDRKLRTSQDQLLVNEYGELETLLPEAYLDAHMLHPEYTNNFTSCSQEEWERWINGGGARLSKLPALTRRYIWFNSLRHFETHVTQIISTWQPYYPYKTGYYPNQRYGLEEYDFPDVVVRYWESALPTENPWRTIVHLLLQLRPSYWQGKEAAIPHQTSTNGNSIKHISGDTIIPAAWVVRLRETACLPDTRGFYHKPYELMRRTPRTEALLDVEPFVDGQLDTEANRPLLDLLGVRSTPMGPERLLERLRILAQAPKPPLAEVDKYYRRLDQMIHSCSTADAIQIKQTFAAEALILTNDGCWATSSALFISAGEEGFTDIALVRDAVADLALWRRIGVADRPSAELVMQWLKQLPSSSQLAPDELRRVRALLPQLPTRIWEECGHWLNLANAWVPVETLTHSLTMQSLIAWSHLHPNVKQQTADLQRLPGDVTNMPPFSALPTLASRIENRLVNAAHVFRRGQRKEWMMTLGQELARVQLENENEMARVRTLAQELAHTEWQQRHSLQIVPYLDGVPAGTARTAEVVWADRVLYVGPCSMAKLAKIVPEEIAKAFNRPEIKAALDYSFERAPESVRAYVEENFVLARQLTPQVTKERERIAPLQPTTELPSVDSWSSWTEQKGTATLTDTEEHRGLSQDAAAVDQDDDIGWSEEEMSDEWLRDTPIIGPNGVPPVTIDAKTKPEYRPIILRFAMAHGFLPQGNGRYRHADGRWIERARDANGYWEQHSAIGNLLRVYLPKAHCLETSPLQIHAEWWWLLEQFPDLYSLILADREGNPVEVTGEQLRTLFDDSKISLYPATYRLVYNDEHLLV